MDTSSISCLTARGMYTPSMRESWPAHLVHLLLKGRGGCHAYFIQCMETGTTFVSSFPLPLRALKLEIEEESIPFRCL